MKVSDLPTLNATLNSAATLLIISGLLAIKFNRRTAHAAFMTLALVTSTAFLVSYVTYHVMAGHVVFSGKGWSKWVYYPLLVSHVLLAASCVVLVPMTVIRAVRGQFEKHRAIAKWTLPIWLYVSVTGVLVYLMCYIWFA